ncbi:hypothetical protein M409DRAFT_51121 [Zasmidium cellare ATCC 36951]|uniref:Uncharacterized protein n=1 Tax=Zasmidium cellare ATCC 36951 TaxID=1080233 RepID=A0A6A6CUN5_ZASCE|nr:uncharacterized protein M409DRAFT_51121 [Zasmidium cellare ATCC 36951]KAF2170874.1 hypothetical protein M409DRAFT_51121 [Zasmidium cellare ATCC 36951]
MGDFGGPLLSTVETLPVRSKSSALHVEDCQSPKDVTADIHLDRAPTSHININMSQDQKLSLEPVDTPLQHSYTNTPAEPATPTSDQPSKALPEERKSKGFAVKTSQNSRPPTTASAASSFKPSTPIRTYREHPRLWIEDGPGAGKAIAEWRQKFVPIFEEQTKDMTMEERTKAFDKMVKEDEDRYCQALATYYSVHPEHLPEREVDPKTQKKIDVGFTESPKYDMMQQKCFGDWDNWGPRTTDLTPEVGPKNEPTPDDPIPECEHCAKEAKKARSLVCKVFSKFSSSSKEKDHPHNKPTRRATVDSTHDARPNVVISIPDQSPEDQVVDDHELASSDHSGSSSSDGKQREALTETGVELTKAEPKKKRLSLVQRMRLSTVHTR